MKIKVAPKQYFLSQYHLTRRGISKLCFYEYKYHLHEKFQPTYASDGMQQAYTISIGKEQRIHPFVPEKYRTKSK